VTQISAGGAHTCAVKTGGTPVCWGYNDRGQATIPAGVGTVTQITAGDDHTCAIQADGHPICWGGADDRLTTIPDAIGGAVSQISAGALHTCAVRIDNTPSCWGNNASGQTGAPALHAYSAAPLAPANSAPPAISGRPKVGHTLTGTAGAWDYAPTSFKYEWRRCTTITLDSCHTIAGPHHTTRADHAIHHLVAEDDNMYLRILVTATNRAGHTRQVSHHTVQVTLHKPILSAGPEISGTPKVDSALHATHGAWENAPTGYAYAWSRCTDVTLHTCHPIADAHHATHTLIGADDNHYLRVTVTATNHYASIAGAPVLTAKITRLAPVVITPPTILIDVAGVYRPYPNGRLTATPGEWANHPATYSYHWRRCYASCDWIGANDSVYVVAIGDIGFRIKVTVTAINSGGATSAESEATNLTGTG
jgi:hypothetical protein